MKKRILACLCALVLCLGLLVGTGSVYAVDDPCFMAVNDTLLKLEDQYIPITVDGQYYVPYTALDSNVTGLKLGITPIYNETQNTLTVYDREAVITFDLTAGTCRDSNGNLSARAVTRNGRIYVPVRFVCNYFGLAYTNKVTTYGPLVRVRNDSVVLDDNNFVGMAQLQMESRLQEWRKAQDVESVLPVAPGRIPEAETDKSGVSTYLAFRMDTMDGLRELLARMDYHQVHALFFFPVKELAGCEETVRQVLVEGHAVGFLVDGTDAQEISAQVAEGNRVLSQIAHMNTYIVLAADAQTDEERATIEAAGLLCWNADLDAVPNGHSASQQADAVLAEADQYNEKIYILSDASAAGASLMGNLLPKLVRNRYNLRLAVETEI